MKVPPLRIGLAQLNYKICDFKRNLARLRTAIERTTDMDILVFSELCLSGYYPQDLVEEPDFLQRQDEALATVLELSRSTRAAIVLGAVTSNPGVGKAFFNSLLVLRDGAILLTYNKQLLPTYNIFDERRHFEPGRKAAATLEIKGHKIGFLICEDGWNDEEQDYVTNPLRTLQEADASLVVSINASPSNVGKQRLRHDVFAAVARRRGLPIVYVNQVGGNDQLVYDGGSFLVEPDAGVVHELPLFEEAIACVVFDKGRFTTDGRAIRYGTDSELYYGQILLGLRDYVEKSGFHGVVVGSSGGIDSALTLALAADALGSENVQAITMPSAFSSSGSVTDSEHLCENLGVQIFTHEIKTIFDAFATGFVTAFGTASTGLTTENVQARIRGAILMEFSNQFGHLVLSTGNKSEMSVGYATLYGDMNGGLNLIGDLYKTEVFELARYYNARHRREVIPMSIIAKAPSAELAPGQKDTDSLPPYPVLDEILKLHIEGRRLRAAEYDRATSSVEELKASGQSSTVQKVLSLVAKAEFKRRQAPPIVRVRGLAFGTGRQMPIAASYSPSGVP